MPAIRDALAAHDYDRAADLIELAIPVIGVSCRLPGTIALYRAALTQARGDVAGTVLHAREVLELSRDDDVLNRAGAAGFLGLASWASGDLEQPSAHTRTHRSCPEARAWAST